MLSAMMFPSWQETFVALHAAETCEELWAVLLAPHGIRSSSAWEEPFILFSRFHRDDTDDATITALLVCTDTRWRKGAHRLIRQLVDSGMLDNTALDDLAISFLEPQVTLAAVSELDSDQSVVAGSHASRSGNVRTSADATTGHQLIVKRPIWPPLRRWAAARQVHRDPARWRDLLGLARSSPSSDATAIAAGVMDAADLIPPADRVEALEQGMEWGSGTVRLAALPGFGRLQGDEAARRRARQDPSEKVRKWAKNPPQPTADPHSGAGSQPRTAGETDADCYQTSLFGAPAPDE